MRDRRGPCNKKGQLWLSTGSLLPLFVLGSHERLKVYGVAQQHIEPKHAFMSTHQGPVGRVKAKVVGRPQRAQCVLCAGAAAGCLVRRCTSSDCCDRPATTPHCGHVRGSGLVRFTRTLWLPRRRSSSAPSRPMKPTGTCANCQLLEEAMFVTCTLLRTPVGEA